MPPRYAYWTIIVDDKPTAFRSGSQEELMPTFKRLKAKNDTAVMMWFQIGKLWPSRVAAQEFMHARAETGRKSDERQPGSGFRDRKSKPSSPQAFKPSRSERTAWTPRGEPSTPAPARNADEKLDWKPKGEFVPAPKRADRAEWKPRDEKPEWKPKASRPQSPKAFEDRPRSFKRPDFKSSGDDTRSAKPEWKPKGSFTPAPRRSEGSDWKSKASRPQSPRAGEKPEWKPKGSFTPAPRRSEGSDWKSKASRPQSPRAGEKPEWKPKGSFTPAPRRSEGSDWKSKTSRPQDLRTSRSEKPEWKPKGEGYKPKAPEGFTPSGEKRKWMPKEEYKKSMGIEAKRDGKWRPGGEHKDPKQKYKDAKKAKWSKFKQNIRARSGGKGKKPS